MPDMTQLEEMRKALHRIAASANREVEGRTPDEIATSVIGVLSWYIDELAKAQSENVKRRAAGGEDLEQRVADLEYLHMTRTMDDPRPFIEAGNRIRERVLARKKGER